MKILSIGAVALLTGVSALADATFIRELEDLRNSLPPEDASRQALTLRLADTLFDEAGEIAKSPELSAAQGNTIATYRKRAVALYRESLESANGRPKLKIEFQMGRLYSDLGMAAEASKIWSGLLSQEQLPDLKREAALRIAETAEEDGRHGEAERLYMIALDLCGGGDLCSYARYRLAWTLRNQNKLNPAIVEMRHALWDSKGQLREESLRDYVAFLAAEPGDGKKALSLIESLADKISRPSLIVDLADAFFSGGNSTAGTVVLAFANTRNPEARHQVRLLEQYYAQKQSEKFQETLASLESSGKILDLASHADVEKMVHRLTVQLDGERISRPQFASDFQRVVTLHLMMFPASKDRMKMVGGWLAAETDPSRKISQTKAWIQDSRFAWNADEQIKIREFRADAARIAKDFGVVAEETQALAQVPGTGDQARNYRYSHARALYEMKDYAQALPIFRELAAVTDASAPLKYAVESQNLALDILGQQKDYRGIMAQAATWTSNPALANATGEIKPEIKKELGDIREIAEKAEFELAASMGQTDESLAIFRGFCEAKKHLPRSCDNAKVLAVRLRNQPVLITILKAQNAASELAAEYEASGLFAEAAELMEAQAKRSKATPEFLKIALLYELGGRNPQRDRVLSLMMEQIRAQKSIGPEEPAIYAWLKEAKLLNAKSLSMPWSAATRAKLADWLESNGNGTSETRRVLTASISSTGPAWDRWVEQATDALDATQKKISFHGANGQRKFEARLAALKKLVAHGERYLSGAAPQLRIVLLGKLVRAHQNVADEILASPVPAQLSETEAEGVRQALAEMAKPFQQKVGAYEALIAQQQSPSSVEPVLTAVASMDRSEIEAAIPAMRADPASEAAKQAMTRIQNHYQAQGQYRWAAYFKGRLAQMAQEGSGS